MVSSSAVQKYDHFIGDNLSNEALITYIKKSTLKVTSFIYESIKLDRLEKVFISFKEDKDHEIIEYTDGEKMANSEFKKLSEEIRECSLAEDKIQLIKNNIRSMEDLVDMLSADSLFKNEYISYFKSLSEMEIALLSKYVYELSFQEEDKKQWHYEFNKHILSLSGEEQRAIRELKEKIEFPFRL